MGAKRSAVPEPVLEQSIQIGARLAMARRLQRLTAQELAGMAGVSRDSISRLERGDPGVSLGVVLRVAGALRIDPIQIEDPLATPEGRAAALASVPRRVRHRRTSVGQRKAGWQRPVAVPGSLGELRGPQHGRLRLPLSVHASGQGPGREFDLDDDADVLTCYPTIMENGALTDVRELLNREILVRVWNRLWLPPHVRDAWQPLAEEIDDARSPAAPNH